MKITNIEHEEETVYYTIGKSDYKILEVTDYDIIDNWVGIKDVGCNEQTETFGYIIDGNKYEFLSDYEIKDFMIEDFIKQCHKN